GPPLVEDSDECPAFWVGGLDLGDAVDRVAHSEVEQRVAAPLCPQLIGAEGLSGVEFGLAAPAPDGEGGGEQRGARGEDGVEKAGGELALLGIFHARVEVRVE